MSLEGKDCHWEGWPHPLWQEGRRRILCSALGGPFRHCAQRSVEDKVRVEVRDSFTRVSTESQYFHNGHLIFPEFGAIASLSIIGFAFGEEQYQLIIDKHVATGNDGVIVRYQATTIRDVAALDVQSLGCPVIRIQTKSNTDGFVLLKGPLLDGVHQLGTDAMAAKRWNHIEVLDFRMPCSWKKAYSLSCTRCPHPAKSSLCKARNVIRCPVRFSCQQRSI